MLEAGAQVIGADASPELVAAARERGIDAQIVDGQALSFNAEFDAVFSNAALHWMKRDPDAVLAGVRSEEHTSELQSLMRISYAVFCLKKTTNTNNRHIGIILEPRISDDINTDANKKN